MKISFQPNIRANLMRGWEIYLQNIVEVFVLKDFFFRNIHISKLYFYIKIISSVILNIYFLYEWYILQIGLFIVYVCVCVLLFKNIACKNWLSFIIWSVLKIQISFFSRCNRKIIARTRNIFVKYCRSVGFEWIFSKVTYFKNMFFYIEKSLL